MKKRILSMILALSMVLSLFPSVQFAAVEVAKWGVAGAGDSLPDTWAGSGTILEAMAYANSLGAGTAYIQLLDHALTTEPLDF